MLKNLLRVNTSHKNQADMLYRSVYHQATSVTLPPDLDIPLKMKETTLFNSYFNCFYLKCYVHFLFISSESFVT